MYQKELVCANLICFDLVICAAPLAHAQTTDEYNGAEFFAGFSHNQVDTGVDEDPDDLFEDEIEEFFNERSGYNGFELSAVGNFHKYVGAKFDFSAHYDDQAFTVAVPPGSQRRDVGVRSALYNVLFGVQFKNNLKEADARVKPFAHALAGVGIARNEFSGLDDIPGVDDDFDESGFAAAVGGGLDVRLSDRVDLRAFQIDYNPTRFFGATQHNARFGIGVVFH